jgi:hypothetical protein
VDAEMRTTLRRSTTSFSASRSERSDLVVVAGGGSGCDLRLLRGPLEALRVNLADQLKAGSRVTTASGRNVNFRRPLKRHD